MRHALTILAALFVCAAPAQAQTLKSLMYNMSNGYVFIPGGMNVQFTNRIIGLSFQANTNSIEIYKPLYFAPQASSNVFEFEDDSVKNLAKANLGLGATNDVVFQSVQAGTNDPFVTFDNLGITIDSTNANTGAAGIAFIGAGANRMAANTRTNLGATTIGSAVFTATNATAARQALGLQSYSLTLTNSINDVEIGSTVSNVTIGWMIAPTDATYAVRTLVGASQTNSITNNSSTLALTGLALTSNTTWTLTVGDGLGVTNTATTAVNFLNYMVWGRSTNTTLANTAIQTLHTNGGGSSRAFATSRSRSFTMDGGGQFIFIAYPAGFGSASFTVGGLPNTAFTLTTNSYTNASGYVTNFLIYRTDTIQNGTGINFVVQ